MTKNPMVRDDDRGLLEKVKNNQQDYSDKDFSGTQKFARAVRNVGKKVERWVEGVKK